MSRSVFAVPFANGRFGRCTTTPRAIYSVVLVATLAALASPALGQKPSSVNAATQARDRMMQSHRQTGSFAGGYRPYSTWTYQSAAQSHAQALSSYGESCPQVSPATAREHLAEIRRNLVAATKESAKFSDDAAKQAEVQGHLDAMRKHQDAAAKLCDRMEKAIGDDKVDCAEVCACCESIDKELQAADAEHRAILEKIGVKHPAAARAAQQSPGENTPNGK